MCTCWERSAWCTHDLATRTLASATPPVWEGLKGERARATIRPSPSHEHVHQPPTPNHTAFGAMPHNRNVSGAHAHIHAASHMSLWPPPVGPLGSQGVPYWACYCNCSIHARVPPLYNLTLSLLDFQANSSTSGSCLEESTVTLK